MNIAPSTRPTASSRSALSRLAADERGAATVEYILIAGMIAIACITAFQNFGQAVLDKVTEQTTSIGGITSSP